MTRFAIAILAGCLITNASFAGWLFPRGAEALRYGPYTGGHGYSYNTAYSYGFAFSSADTWRRDIFAYPGGINPYRPYGRPITNRVFPTPQVPFLAVPGPDGLHTLIHPPASTEPDFLVPGATMPAPTLQPVPLSPVITSSNASPVPALAPVPAASAGRIRIQAPASAEVWVEKDAVAAQGSERLYQTPDLPAGQVRVYSVKARWIENGREVEQFRVVGIKAGETARLVFGR